MSSKDDPVERHWEARVDQAAQAAAHERDIETIRSVDELRGGHGDREDGSRGVGLQAATRAGGP
jgi:hypothetical protein